RYSKKDSARAESPRTQVICFSLCRSCAPPPAPPKGRGANAIFQSDLYKMRLNLRKALAQTLVLVLCLVAVAQSQPRQRSQPQSFDIIIKGGTVYDGTGRAPRLADVGILKDRIAAIGNLSRATAPTIVDAKGLAVAPGFINMLAHSESSLIVDPRSLSELKQGVTTQIFGEFSMGPLNDQLKQRMRGTQGDVKYEIEWTTLSEYLNYLEKRGISQN